METLYHTGPLYKKDTHGNIRIWKGEAFEDDGVAYAKTIAGQLTGKQKEHRTQVAPTTKYTASHAAVAKIRNAENDKLRKGYFRTQEEALDYKPNKLMLIHKWDDHKDKMSWPCFVQPKLDGICAGYMDDVNDPHFKSREDNRFEKLDTLAKNISLWLDAHHGVDRERMDAHGELYAHGRGVSELVEAIKGDNPDVFNELQFHIFDFMPKDAEVLYFTNRLRAGLDFFGTKEITKPFRIVKTLIAHDEAQVDAHYEFFVSQGYEGLVICNRIGGYEYDRRTYNKLKKKNLITEEFEITGFQEERNGEQELIMFTCVTADGITFKVRPKWSHEKREAALTQQRNGSVNYIGEMATVEYRSVTQYGTPFHGVMISTRNYE
jgi:hypothetical protein